MKEPYNISRFREHWDKGCEPLKDQSTQLITTFFSKRSKSQTCPTLSTKPSSVPLVERPCPGLTKHVDQLYGPKILYYLMHTAALNGGSRNHNHYSQKYFGKAFSKLTDDQKSQVYTYKLHDCAWKNNTMPEVMAVFSVMFRKVLTVKENDRSPPQPCKDCKLILHSRAFQSALNKH